jgi:hypothetical protein
VHILTIQIHDSIKGWIDAAELRFHARSEVEIEYDIDYATTFLGSVDHHALSVNYPVSLDPFRGEIPGYLIDLIPQGQVLKRLLNLNGIKKDSDYEEILSRIPLASPGNIRIKESWSKIELERPSYEHDGFKRDDLLAANTNFLKYMEEHGAPIGGTSGERSPAICKKQWPLPGEKSSDNRGSFRFTVIDIFRRIRMRQEIRCFQSCRRISSCTGGICVHIFTTSLR